MGRGLLYSVVWHKNQNFLSICDKYVYYEELKYQKQAIVVLATFPDDIHYDTKIADDMRRSGKHASIDILNDEQ